MSNTLVRVVMSVALLFALPFVYMLAFMVMEPVSGLPDETAMMLGAGITGLCVLFGWSLIWAWQVRWTPLRLVLTFVSVPAAGVPGGAAAATAALVSEWEGEVFGAIFGLTFWVLGWLVITSLIWRETYRERIARLGKAWCPTCGQDMRGQHRAECPRCGARYSLDELLDLLEHQQRPPRPTEDALPELTPEA